MIRAALEYSYIVDFIKVWVLKSLFCLFCSIGYTEILQVSISAGSKPDWLSANQASALSVCTYSQEQHS